MTKLSISCWIWASVRQLVTVGGPPANWALGRGYGSVSTSTPPNLTLYFATAPVRSLYCGPIESTF